MSKHRIIFEKDIDEKTNEQELIEEIQKKEFFCWMTKNGYSFNEIQEIFEGKISAEEQNRFNLTLKKAKVEMNISLIESIVFFEAAFGKFKKILAVLDSDTKYELKKEFAENYKIKLDKNNLIQILD